MPYGHHLAAVAVLLALLVAADDSGRPDPLHPERSGAGPMPPRPDPQPDTLNPEKPGTGPMPPSRDAQPPRLPPNQTLNDTTRPGSDLPGDDGQSHPQGLPPRGEGFASGVGPHPDRSAHGDGDSRAFNRSGGASEAVEGNPRDQSFGGPHQRPFGGGDEGSHPRGGGSQSGNASHPRRPPCQRAPNGTRPNPPSQERNASGPRGGPGASHDPNPMGQNGPHSNSQPSERGPRGEPFDPISLNATEGEGAESCPESFPSNPSGAEPHGMRGSQGAGSLAGSSGSFLGAAYGANMNGGASDEQRAGLSRKGVILVAVGGALLAAGLASLAMVVIMHRRSTQRVREISRQNNVSPIAVVEAGKAGPVVPDVDFIESTDVCVGVVVPDNEPMPVTHKLV